VGRGGDRRQDDDGDGDRWETDHADSPWLDEG
jgi:hypothetical protein